jgi:hypothetical protein
MEGLGEAEYLKPNFQKKQQSNVEFEAKTTRAKEGDLGSSKSSKQNRGYP